MISEDREDQLFQAFMDCLIHELSKEEPRIGVLELIFEYLKHFEISPITGVQNTKTKELMSKLPYGRD